MHATYPDPAVEAGAYFRFSASGFSDDEWSSDDISGGTSAGAYVNDDMEEQGLALLPILYSSAHQKYTAASTYQLTDTFTVEFLLKKRLVSSPTSYLFFYVANTSSISLSGATLTYGGSTYATGFTYTHETARHYAIQKSGTTLYCLQDGVVTSTHTVPSSPSMSAGRIRIGSGSDPGNEFYIDEFRMTYDEAIYAVDDTAQPIFYPSGGMHLPLDDSLSDAYSRHTPSGTSITYSSRYRWGGSHSAYFDGSTSLVEVTDNMDDFVLDNSLDWTLQCFFRADAIVSQNLFKNNDLSFYVDIKSSSQVDVHIGGTTASFSDLSMTAEQWHWLIISMNKGTLRLFVDAQQSATESTSAGTYATPTSFSIGSGFSGYMDEVRLTVGRGVEFVSEADFDDAMFTGAAGEISRSGGVYVTEPIPEDAEAHAITSQLTYSYGNGNELRGIAEANGILYLLHRNSIYILEGESATGYQAIPFANGIGCASHATISDRNSNHIYFYSGQHVYRLSSLDPPQLVSYPIADLLENMVDHSRDHRTHGCYDPFRRRYHLWLFPRGGIGNQEIEAPTLRFTYHELEDEWSMTIQLACLSVVRPDSSGRLTTYVALPDHYAKMTYNATTDVADESGTFTGDDSFTTTTFTLDAGGLTGTLNGAPVWIHDSNGALVCMRYVKSSTADTVTIYGTWPRTLVAGDTYKIGWIRHHFQVSDAGLMEEGGPAEEKVVQRAFLHMDSINENNVRFRVAGLRESSTKKVETSVALSQDEDIWLQKGLRSRGFQIDVEGLTNKMHTIHGLELLVKAVKHR